MTLPFVAMTLFAEDLRNEVQGIASLIGILPDNIGVSSFPSMLPKLAIYTRCLLTVDLEPVSTTIVARHVDGSLIVLAEFAQELLDATRADAVSQGKTFYGLIGQAVSSPFPVTGPGQMDVIVKMGSAEQITGSLNFVLGT